MNLVPGFSAAPPDSYAEPVHAYPPVPDDRAKIFFIDILAAIYRNRGLAIVVALLAAMAVWLVTLSITPLYKSSASIMLIQPNSSSTCRRCFPTFHPTRLWWIRNPAAQITRPGAQGDR